MTKSKFSTKYLVEMALLVAIILLMAFTPIGYIKTAGLEITLIVIPVAVGAVTLGPAAGAILGGVFGITSFIQGFGMSAFGTLLLGVNPVFTFLVCVPTRMADRTDLQGTEEDENTFRRFGNACQPLLSAAEHHIFHGNSGNSVRRNNA